MSSFVSNAHAGTTTADFLEWDRKAQEAFIQNSISMTGVIASQNAPQIAACIDEWYFKNHEVAQNRNDEILMAMAQYKAFKPQAVLLAVLEGVCGKFDRK